MTILLILEMNKQDDKKCVIKNALQYLKNYIQVVHEIEDLN